jgi:hypothetical protein|tara:strand:- start:45 stop:641 length:597 start_codon:yes stop_codon:yes gene_type:complete
MRRSLCLIFILFCCAKTEDEPLQLLGAWSLPSMPAIEIEIDETLVSAETIEAFFKPIWANFCAEQALKAEPAFSSDQFVQDKLNEVKKFVGEELLRREALLNGITVAELKEQFIFYAPEVSEAEVMEMYTKLVLDPLPPAAEREQQPLDYEDVAPRLRKQLQEELGMLEQSRWLEDRLEDATAVLKIEGLSPIFVYGG